jgi:hypothetical protein
MTVIVVVVDPARARDDLAGEDAIAGVHMRGARHAGIERADRAQDVDALEVLRPLVVLQQRGGCHRLLVWPGIAERILG